MKSIDLFCGAGGFSEGLRHAGVETVFAADFDEQAIMTFSKNHPNVRSLCADVSDLSAEKILSEAGLSRGDVDLVVGGPPCQGFSLAGPRLPNDPKNKLVLQYKRIVFEIKPRFFIFENVSGILSMQGGKVLNALQNEFASMGYKVSSKVVNAADYGVPQLRPRFIMIGTLDSKETGFPVPSHGDPDKMYHSSLLNNGKVPYVTVREALEDLPEIEQGEGEEKAAHTGGYKNQFQLERKGSREPGVVYNHRATRHSQPIVERYSQIPPGCSNGCLPEEIRTKKINVFRLHPDRPSRTVTCNFRTDLLHPWIPRGTTVREAARLQSFDDDYQFFGNLTRKAKWVTQDDQVGNAVPPLLAKALALHVLKCSKD